MTLFEHIINFDKTGKVIRLNEQGQLVINRKEYDNAVYNDNDFVGTIAIGIALFKTIYKDARYYEATPCRIPAEIREQMQQTIVTIPDDITQILKSIEAVVDPEVDPSEELLVRRPYYRLRGKPITKEQAMDIIRRTDYIFRWGEARDAMAPDHILGSYHFENQWLATVCTISLGGYGWAHPDGSIGSNGTTQKNPNSHEIFFNEILEYKINFPYLDLIVAITHWNELPDYLLEDDDAVEDYTEKRGKFFKGFIESIKYAVWIHDNKIEALGPTKAKAIYQEYDKLYGLEDEGRYTYWDNTEIYNREELSKQCYLANGADPEAVYNQKRNRRE